MKKMLVLIFTLCLCLSGCAHFVTLPQREPLTLPKDDNTRTSLRMFMADGFLYYDTGLVSDNTQRCGTMDGALKHAAEAFCVPTADGICNFDGAEGYQNATSITKEVLIENEGWCIFKKIDAAPESLQAMPYCVRITGKISSTAKPSTLCLLTQSLSVTIRDVFEPLFSSKYPTTPKYITHVLSDDALTDDWGITLTATNVTPIECTLRFEQLGGNAKGWLETGLPFYIEKLSDDGSWTKLTPIQEPVWNMPAFLIPENEVYEMDIHWMQIYDALPTGNYRVVKTVYDRTNGSGSTEKTYYAYFDITEAMLDSYIVSDPKAKP